MGGLRERSVAGECFSDPGGGFSGFSAIASWADCCGCESEDFTGVVTREGIAGNCLPVAWVCVCVCV